MENDILRALRERRSIRRFKPEQIKDEELQAVLEAGTWAPTAKGLQDPWIIAVQRPDLVERIDRLNGEIWGHPHPFYGAPTIILVFGSDPAVWPNSFQDGSLVLGNMMLAAHAVGNVPDARRKRADAGTRAGNGRIGRHRSPRRGVSCILPAFSQSTERQLLPYH